MRTIGIAVAGLFGGLVFGFVLSEAIAIAAVLAMGGSPDMPWLRALRYLPLLFAVAGAVGAPLVDARIRRGRAAG
ncbi:DUF5957 family protein [Allonocardiopsis opalescens]|uniref:Uncharacterized protein n=1 Tax=Allonocardiopsis opalescens TaxID=1144618 RepID=A0A2T0Q7S9_9ACTN|nr:DUF5957 family protein [Allonocardiopsis opalescens]PRX99793.1 hypothetical protein CLV72_103399 [Allonocardiopsis opalescens]